GEVETTVGAANSIDLAVGGRGHPEALPGGGYADTGGPRVALGVVLSHGRQEAAAAIGPADGVELAVRGRCAEIAAGGGHAGTGSPGVGGWVVFFHRRQEAASAVFSA